MTPASMTLEDALKMLSLPRVVGEHPESHEPITAQLGRYGPYITCGKDSRSVEKEEDVFTITLEQALQLLAQPKTRGRRKAAEPIKTLGKDEFSGGEITLREGRFGYYVTDGETNASLSKGDSIETIDNARAQELLHNRRERGPVTKKKAKKKAAAKAAKADKSAQKAAANASEANGEPDEHDEDEAPASARKSAAPRASARPAGKKAPAKKLASKKAPAKKAAPKNNSSRARASESTDGGERRSAPAGNKKRPSAKSGSRSKSLD
jgi:DNA topoisomerase-1